MALTPASRPDKTAMKSGVKAKSCIISAYLKEPKYEAVMKLGEKLCTYCEFDCVWLSCSLTHDPPLHGYPGFHWNSTICKTIEIR
jgi:hypothetical protein